MGYEECHCLYIFDWIAKSRMVHTLTARFKERIEVQFRSARFHSSVNTSMLNAGEESYC